MWWELEWESKEAANSAWNELVTNADVMEWTNKYQDVMSCDGAGRNA